MIIPSDYSSFGQIVERPDRPDKTEAQWEAERRADTITYAQLLKEERWTTEDFQIATAYGFPSQKGMITPAFDWSRGAGIVGGEPCYSRTQIAKWKAAFKAFAAKVR